MTAQATLTAVVVEDERFVRADLCHMLRAHGAVEVVGEASTLQEARAVLARCRPDVVFLDIQLRGEVGFDLIPDIDARTNVVFVTAYDRYAVRAFEVNALDFIVKPVAPERLADAIARLDARGQRRVPAAPTHALEPDDSIFVDHDQGRRFVHLAEITAIISIGGNYTLVERVDARPLTVRRALKVWSELLPPTMFLTVHRSGIANMQRAERLVRQRSGGLGLVIAGRDEPVPVSRRRAPAIRSLLACR